MHNYIYALDPKDGHTLWSEQPEKPCPSSCIPSGDSIPSDAVGIMSTPVIDPTANVLYAGATVTLTISVLAPSRTGSMYLEAEMIKDHQFWFAQTAAIAVMVS